jgi:outer membrane protein
LKLSPLDWVTTNPNLNLSFNSIMAKNFFITLTLLSSFGLAQAKDLITVYQMALDKDPALKQALAQRNAAKQNFPIALAPLLPNVNASASSTSTENIILNNTEFDVVDAGVIKQYGYMFNGQQTLINVNQWFTLAQASEIANSADSTFIAYEQSLIVKVASAYFDVLNAQDDLTFTQAEKNALEQQLKQTQEKFNVGLVAITDLHDFRAQFDGSIAKELSAQNALDDAKERLKVIIGQTIIDLNPLEKQLPLESPNPIDIEEWVNFAQSHNPTLIAAQANMKAQDNNVTAQFAQHLPNVYATGSFGSAETGLWLNPQGDSDSGWSVGLNAEMNIFAGGGIQANVRQAQYNYEDAKEAFEETRRTTTSNARIAYRGVLTAISQVQALNQAVISAQSSFDANSASYEVGVKTSVDVLDSLSRLYSQQRNLAAARYSYILQMLKLKQAAGTLNMEDVMLVNQWLADLPA